MHTGETIKMAKLFVALFALFAVAAATPALSPADWRIVGGDNAAQGQFPYIVSLRYHGSHTCGGSIINANWILTAAHCVDGRADPSAFTVVTGTNQLTGAGVSYNVEKIVQHADYDDWDIVNDIAMMKVASAISFDSNTQPIELESSNNDIARDAVLCGWGTTSYPGSAPQNLQFIDLKTVTVADCQSAHSNAVFASQVCTFTQRGEGACHGDSGGPLASNGKQIGIVSWGMPCAVGYPDVFTRVSSFYSWIQANMQ